MLSDMEMHLDSTPINARGQGHLVTFNKGHLSFVCHHFQITSSPELLDQFQLNF